MESLIKDLKEFGIDLSEKQTQEFYNYYAYDDGIPEKGYGVTPHNSSLASQFSISVPDTLQGVQILFNRTFKDAMIKFAAINGYDEHFQNAQFSISLTPFPIVTVVNDEEENAYCSIDVTLSGIV